MVSVWELSLGFLFFRDREEAGSGFVRSPTSVCCRPSTNPMRFRSSHHHPVVFFELRTPDGEMFVVKDPDVFAANIIPQYFDHNKFSSFARQLNFYGFRKMQSKPIRNSDFDAATAKHVTFYNEKFKRGRCDLLKEIQRSTRGGTSHGTSDNSKEVQNLRDQVSGLEKKIEDMNIKVEERFRRLELDMLGRMEQMMLAMQQQQQTQLQLQAAAAAGVVAPAPAGSSEVPSSVTIQQQQWDPLPFPRTSSVTSAAGSFSNAAPQVVSQEVAPPTGAPTLPPHPKQKQLPVQSLPTAMALPPSRLNSLRGISRGISGLSRGASVESSASAVLMRNSWEGKQDEWNWSSHLWAVSDLIA